jgi:hypothetical protein
MSKIYRRDFIRYGSVLTAGSLLLPSAFASTSSKEAGTDEPSTVIVVTDENCTSGSQINADIVQIMVNAGITSYTGISDVGQAWMSLFSGITHDSVIGVKVNVINPFVPTNPETTEAVINGLLQMPVPSGFDENNIIIWDRQNSELSSAGYTLNTGSTGVRCFGTNQSGVGYNDSFPLNVNGRTCYPSRIYTDYIDYLINIAVIKDNFRSGATLTLKNHYGTIGTPQQVHDNNCDPYIPALNQQLRDSLGDKQKFCMVDTVFGLSYGGPYGPPNFVHNGIIMSEDTVAVDRIGLDILVENGFSNLTLASHVETASQSPYNLGNYDPGLIERNDIENPSSAVPNGEGNTPQDFHLSVYPNPFNLEARVQFSLAQRSKVALTVHDTLGREVLSLYNDWFSPGDHGVMIDGSGLSSGVYFIRLIAGNISQTQKVVLIK